MIVTVPMAGYVAADKLGGGDVAATPDYLNVRFRRSAPAKGAPFSFPPDTQDATVYQDELVAWLESRFPGAHDRPSRYGFVTLQDAPDAAAHGDFLDWYLSQVRAEEIRAGRRLVDVLDLHWYPEATGGGERITSTGTSAAVVAARLQAPRSLWDPSYTETSWITQWSTSGPIALLPRLQAKIDARDPGVQLAFTEYNYGGGQHISGGIAQADVLGIFGRYGVLAAALWELSADERFLYGGFAMYRNFDGAGGRFGDLSVSAATSDVAGTSVYASIDPWSDDRMVLVALNKTASPLRAGIAVTHTRRFARAETYRLTAASAAPVRDADVPLATNGTLQVLLPPYSVSTLVLRP